MDVVASIIAVLQLSDAVGGHCIRYLKDVKNAKTDIGRLKNEVDDLAKVLKGLQQLLQGPNGMTLATSYSLRDGLEDCSTRLAEVESQLESDINPRLAGKILKSLSFRSLKWPIEKKKVDAIVSALHQYRDTLSAAITVDSAFSISARTIRNISFQSCQSQRTLRSTLTPTSTKHGVILKLVLLFFSISKWAEDPQGKCIYWLNGMAGTGKSTISRTIAKSFADKSMLGASFFFRRGERDRDNASLLFCTIASQLIAWDPALAAQVETAVHADPAVASKALKQQFEKLVLEPLANLKSDRKKTVVLVIDALDECVRDNDVALVIHLLSHVRTLNTVQLRAFVTSRPELPIRFGFIKVRGSYQDLVLHEIPESIIEKDIATFFHYRLREIRNMYAGVRWDEHYLPLDWPGTATVQELVRMAVPLFNFAATSCRFIEDRSVYDPDGQLKKVLKYRSVEDSMDAQYTPILDQLSPGHQPPKKDVVEEFCTVVGSIVLLAEPLSVLSLAPLLQVGESVIDRRLASLHSVLNVPTSAELPVRIFHQSFRDFLVDPEKRATNQFWIDESETHSILALRCLELLTSGNCLQEDICGLKNPGVARAEIDPVAIRTALPDHVRYACLYWVHHLQRASRLVTDSNPALLFLKGHFLHWLEALSLLGQDSACTRLISILKTLASPYGGDGLSAFLQDATRFILNCQSTIDQRPLQVYSSAIVFTPETSEIRALYKGCVPGWISKLPAVGQDWNACLRTIMVDLDEQSASLQASKMAKNWINGISFSSDGKILASASMDRTVRIWDPETGHEKLRLRGHDSCVNAVAFSPDGKTLASASDDKTIRFWDPATGKENLMLEGHCGLVKSITFSPDGRLLASASADCTVRLWDSRTGQEKKNFKGHQYFKSVAFSPDQLSLASSTNDGIIIVWNLATSHEKQRFCGHQGPVNSVTFSPDGETLISSSDDTTIRVWNLEASNESQTFEGHESFVSAVAASPDGKMIASASKDLSVRLWSPASGIHRKLESHHNPINAVAFSKDSKMLASAANDGTIRLWDLTAAEDNPPSGYGAQKQVNVVSFSPNGQVLASGSRDGAIRLWDPSTGLEKHQIHGHESWVNALAFSPNGSILVSASSDNTVRTWDLATRSEMHKFEGHEKWVSAVAFSHDGKTLASALWDHTIRLWDLVQGVETHTLSSSGLASSLSFASDMSYLWADEELINLMPNAAGTSNPAPKKSGPKTLTLNKNQVFWEDKMILQIPESHSPSCGAIYDDTLAMGHILGNVTFMQFTSLLKDFSSNC